MKKLFIALVLFSFCTSHSYSQNEKNKSIGISPALVYDSEYTLFFTPKLSYTHNKSLFELGLNSPIIYELDFRTDYISHPPGYIHYREDKMGVYMAYKRLIPLLNTRNFLYWNISLSNYQRSLWNYDGRLKWNVEEDVFEDIQTDYKRLYHQLMTGFGGQVKVMQNLYFYGDFNFGIENMRNKKTVMYYPSQEIIDDSDKYNTEKNMLRMSIQFGFRYDFYNF